MNNKFDDIIKSQLESMQVAPSKRATRILGFRLFFQNLFQFHKAKVIVGVSTLAIITTFAFWNENFNSEGSNVSKNDEKILNQSFENKSQNLSNSNESIANSQSNPSNSTSNPLKNKNEQKTSTSAVKDATNNFITTSSNKNSTNSIKSSQKNSANTNNVNDQMANSNGVNSNLNNQLSNKNQVQSNFSNDKNTNGIVENNLAVSKQNETLKNKQVDLIDLKDLAKLTSISLGELIGLEQLATLSDEDYANDKSKRGVTIDAFYSVVNKSKINNSIEDGSIYYWDFYKNNGYVASGFKGSVNVNYMYNGFKFGTGVGVNQIKENRPNYRYILDSTTYSSFGGYTVSGTEVEEFDTTLILFTPNNNGIKKAFKSKCNQYQYITIPLNVGYEVYQGKFSFEFNAGVVYQRLINAKGLSVKVADYEDEAKNIFYYKDRYMTTLQDNRDALNKNLIAMNLNLITRFRLLDHLDLMAGLNYNSSLNSIYQQSYFIDKQVQNIGINFGVTYHLNARL